jgi:hypothetical protein
LDVLEEALSHISGAARAIIIADRDFDLSPSSGDIRFFILKIGEGSLAAGGRGGGFGERKVTAVYCFAREGGQWSKLFEAEGDPAGRFEVPYYVSRLPLTLPDGTDEVGYGVVDQALVHELSVEMGAAP